MAFVSGEWLGACFFCLRCLSQTLFTTRALSVMRWYPAPTTAFILPMLLLPAFCCHRTAHDLGLGLQLTVLHSELVLLQRQLPRLPRLQLKSSARNCSLGSGSISFPPSRMKTLVFTFTQDLIRRRHESHKTIMELQSPTRDSWTRTWATDGAIAYW